MRSIRGLLATVVFLSVVPAIYAGPICPTTGNTNSDCAFILTIGGGGSVTGAAVPGAAAYDGSDDALVGVVNSSGSIFSGSIHLTGSGNGGGIFAFDGDGICVYTADVYCGAAATGYEGPLNTFANISPDGTSGDVVISGMADGAATFFSLESSPDSINNGGGIVVAPGGVPEPTTFLLLGSGLAGLIFARRKRRA